MNIYLYTYYKYVIWWMMAQCNDYFKAKIPRSSTSCDLSAISILPPDARQWMCDKPFNLTAVVKNTKCFLTCNYGFEVVQGEWSITSPLVTHVPLPTFIIRQPYFSEGKRSFHRCKADGEWHRPEKVNLTCLSKCKLLKIKENCFREISYAFYLPGRRDFPLLVLRL